MITLLDGQPISPAPDGLAAALDAARVRAESAGRIIIDVRSDGEPIDGRLLSEPPADNAGIGELAMVSADKVAFLTTTIHDAGDALDAAVQKQREAAEFVQQGELEAAGEPLSEALATWQAVRDVVVHASALAGVTPEEIEVPTEQGAVQAQDIIAELVGALEEIKRALTQQDWSALSDAIGYDLEDVAERWRAMLKQLAEVSAGAGA
ncbi:MAG: hypothetical protein AAFR38_10200 [Planctomycetota bacterium]